MSNQTGTGGEALDHFEVEARWGGNWFVSTAMARHIEAALDASPPQGWVTFVDLAGARIRLRTDAIVAVAQSTVAQRALARARYRRLREEHDEDSPLGND